MRIHLAIPVLVASLSIASAAEGHEPVTEFHPDEAVVAKRLTAAGFTFNQAGDYRLRQIFAGEQQVPADLLADLVICKSLQSISLGSHPSHFDALTALPKLPALEILGLTYPLHSPGEMAWTQRLPGLQGLNLEAPEAKELLPEPALWRPGDSDAAVDQLRFLENLLILRLNRQQVTARGLAPLVALEKLRHLELNDTPVDDAALAAVAKFDQLETLHLAGTAVTDRGLAQLGGLARIENLKLDRTAVTGEGLDTLREFEGLRAIKYLYLADTKISDAGLKDLSDLRKLQVLDLSNTPITDAGLVHLAGLKDLYNLNLQGVRVEEETVRWLQDQLPKPNAIVGYTPPDVPLALRLYRQRRPKEDEASKAHIMKIAREWKEKRDPKSAIRLLSLASRLRDEINKHLPFRPYSAPFESALLSGLPDATRGRHTLLGSVHYASSTPPGPGESYINTCLVFLDGDLLATELRRQTRPAADPELYNGYISKSVVVVDGAVGTSSYIGDSIVIAAGPIVVNDGYINNSLVISLEALRPSRKEKDAPPQADIFVRDGYINNSVIVGAVACDDLRDCVIVGPVTTREPYLRGAEIVEFGKVADLPWDVGGE